ANKFTAAISGWTGADTFVVDNPNAADGLTRLDFYGYINPAADPANGLVDDNTSDTFNIRRAGVPVSAYGQGGDDVFKLSSEAASNNGDLNGIRADVTVDGGTGTNALTVSDFGASAGNADVRIGSSTITGFAGAADDKTVTYLNVTSLTVLGS